MRHVPIKSNFRRALCLGFAAASLGGLVTPAALAQSYPSKPIKFVVPFSAGSATDNVGRILAQAMGDAMGQTITVENKAGANGILGAEVVKAAPADGYTFLVTTSTTQAANVHLYRKLPYDPVKDFTPIGKIGETGFILMVNNDFPAKDMKEFVSYAKANPGKLAFGHGSSGSLVSAAMLTELAGLQTVNVPYKSIPPALTDLLGGQIQFAFADTGNAVSQMNGGRMRGLGVTTKKRAGKAPNVPPIGDTVKDYNVSAWFGLMAPAGMPPDVQKKATATLMAVLAKPEVREKIQGVGIDLDVEDSATLAKTIDAEIKKWGSWVKTAGITPE
ncbi:tripartite tricarboxylate transporter substrate binding protein [Limnohabitans sp.]|uniref:Bug family tripartite tricarboxylate transporter substrate binding protein n=1 Tax=Limnohabitans sp. TaxID=1907725 RepID=UPI00286F1694|nr:tripartite tricarboxylate transporter substrate binding protein [Limnohabitans sp.]